MSTKNNKGNYDFSFPTFPVTQMTLNTSQQHFICDMEHRSHEENFFAAVSILVLGIVSMAGNGLVLVSFSHCHLLRQQKGGYFVANLALSDFLCSAYVMIPSAMYLLRGSWRIQGVGCSLHGIFNSTFFTASTLSLTAINVDRAIAVNRPFEYPNLVTISRVKLTVATIWMQCFVLAIIPAGADWITFQSWELMCMPDWSRSNYVYATIAVLVSSGIPSCLVLVSNVSIVYAIRRSRSVVFQDSSGPGGAGRQMVVKKYTKTLRSLYLLVFVYFLCCLPYYVVKYGSVLKGSSVIKEGYCFVPIGLLFVGAAVNPLIYALLLKDHRQAFKDTILMLVGKANNVRKLFQKSPT